MSSCAMFRVYRLRRTVVVVVSMRLRTASATRHGVDMRLGRVRCCLNAIDDGIIAAMFSVASTRCHHGQFVIASVDTNSVCAGLSRSVP